MMNRFELSPDRPLVFSVHDRLGRKPFAEQLAKALLAFKPTESLVVGLLGTWGSGKSTIINFIVEYLEKLDDESQPIVFSFNPWLFSSHEDLVSLFLQELSIKLKQKDYTDLVGKIAEFSESFSEPLKDLGIPGAGMVKPVAQLLKKSLTAKKEGINDALEKSGKKIIVILDDIDRLTPEEIRHVFKLIKAVCDFSNVLYLVSFDKKVVVDALNTFHRDKGEDYLEKIIQVPFEIPALDQENINQLFFEKLEQILESLPANEEEEFYRSGIFRSGIEPYLQTPRDVLRLTNTFSLSFEAVRNEVHWVDFLAIETLKVFNSDLYHEIKNNKSKFAGVPDYLRDDDTVSRSMGTYYDSVFSKFGGDNPEKTEQLLRKLFPKMESNARRINTQEEPLRWRNQLRVCSEEMFDNYFQLSFPRSHIRSADLEKLLQAASNTQDFCRVFMEIADVQNSKGRIDSLLNRLLDYCEAGEIQKENICNVVNSLMLIGDDLIEKHSYERGLLEFETEIQIEILLDRLLKRYKSRDEIYPVLYHAMKQGTSLCIIVKEITVISRGFPAMEQELSAPQLASLKKLGLEKIQKNKDKLLSLPDPLDVLEKWSEWTDNPAEVEDWIKTIALEPEQLKKLLIKTTCSNASGPDLPGIKKFFYIRYSTLEQLITPESIRDKIKEAQKLLDKSDNTYNAINILLKEIDNPELRTQDYYWFMRAEDLE